MVKQVLRYRCRFSRLNTIPACDEQTDRQIPHDDKDRAVQSVAQVTRSSADADNGLDAFSGQSRSITMALFLGYSMSKNVVTLKSGSEVTQGH